MNIYKTRARKIPGTNVSEVKKVAFEIFKRVRRKSKRTPYVRSAYFKKEKIFLNLFWHHVFEKQWGDRKRRLQYFEAAIELIQNSRIDPKIQMDPNSKSDLLYRFQGITKDNFTFCVQIKKDGGSGKKQLISVFPI